MAEPEALFASLYTDEDVTDRLAVLVRQRGFNAQSARDASMAGESDEANLAYAADHGMVLLSFNQRDYVSLAQQWVRRGRSHSGILLSDQFALDEVGELLRRVLRFLNTVPASDMVNAVRYLSEFR